MKYLLTFCQRLLACLAHRYAFRGIVICLILEASWIALTSHYPMAFDEDFHLGIIKIYAGHLSPFLTQQPAHADVYGAVARDPSYLYHYLMSFPYRLVSFWTNSSYIQVLVLRFINIGLFAVSLPFYRNLFRRLGAPQAVINGCLAFFMLIPVVPLLAAQINYDNLFVPLVASTLLLTLKLTTQLRERQSLNLPLFMVTLSVCLLTSLVKYVYLPIFMALALFFVIQLLRNRPISAIRKGYTRSSKRLLLAAGLLTVVAAGLFSQRYVVNSIDYGKPLPDCAAVIGVKACSSYGPWIRDYDFEVNKVSVQHNPIAYMGDWLYGMWLRLYFAVDGPLTQYQSRGPLPVPALSAIVVGAAGLISLVFGFPGLLRRYESTTVWLLFGTAAFYVTILWLDNYEAYIRTGQPVAINGRYLVPFLLIFMVLAVLAAQNLWQRYRSIGTILVVLAIGSQLWGGGALTYILRSEPSWYWPNNPAYGANDAVKHVLGPIMPGYHDPAMFLR